jgi:hypothetical protein
MTGFRIKSGVTTLNWRSPFTGQMKGDLYFMNKFKPFLAVILFFFFFSPLYAKPPDEVVNAVLASAETTFKAMKEKNYPAIWNSLSAKTRRSAVDAVYKASRKANFELEKEKIVADFAKGGELAKAYWDGYMEVFDPDTVLEQSKWGIGTIGKDTAEINILYRKSTKPAVLKLYREDNVWKVGLEETFGARNLLP